jgi:hypothetical protein
VARDRKWLLAATLCIAAAGCGGRQIVVDEGDGHLVDARGRPAYHVDDYREGDAQWKSESRNEIMIEEGVEDAIEDAER